MESEQLSISQWAPAPTVETIDPNQAANFHPPIKNLTLSLPDKQFNRNKTNLFSRWWSWFSAWITVQFGRNSVDLKLNLGLNIRPNSDGLFESLRLRGCGVRVGRGFITRIGLRRTVVKLIVRCWRRLVFMIIDRFRLDLLLIGLDLATFDHRHEFIIRRPYRRGLQNLLQLVDTVNWYIEIKVVDGSDDRWCGLSFGRW